jgi:SNF2 family DNA or RNA helicase
MIPVSRIWAAKPDDLRLVAKVVSGFPSQAIQGDQPTVDSVLTVALDVVPDGTASSVVRPFRLRSVGCVFGESRAVERVPPNRASAEMTDEAGSTSAPNAESAASGQSQRRFTRMRPPRDVIKLEDRLRLLLEPPLESLLAAESLRFAARPFPYQLEGIAFLYPRYQAVLADEMGLGKTMQAITAVRLLVHHGHLRRTLLVCPKPLVTNWQREFARWAPELTVTVLEGSPARRQWLWQRLNDAVTIANYETVVRDGRELCDREGNYDLVILDEAQRIKNRSNITNQIASAIPTARSWALTGTPIENSIEDLVGIFEFVAPGQVDEAMQPRAIGRIAADYVLRRTKEQVLTELPPKLFRDAEVELTAEQAASYQLAAENGVVRLRELKGEITIQHVFELVLRLKQICNFDPTTGSSSKLERLEADIEECAASGRKAIVFSQWVETLKELQRRLSRFSPLEFHGQVPQRRRDGVIERFRDDPNCHVMLMTYGAGSVGLNLQFASYVFLFDRWWNPAVEDQAINRAHRIGVKSPVTITRFLTVGTIEQRINDILEKKRELFATVFDSSIAAQRNSLSSEEVFSLFDLRADENETTVAA